MPYQSEKAIPSSVYPYSSSEKSWSFNGYHEYKDLSGLESCHRKYLFEGTEMEDVLEFHEAVRFLGQKYRQRVKSCCLLAREWIPARCSEPRQLD